MKFQDLCNVEYRDFSGCHAAQVGRFTNYFSAKRWATCGPLSATTIHSHFPTSPSPSIFKFNDICFLDRVNDYNSDDIYHHWITHCFRHSNYLSYSPGNSFAIKEERGLQSTGKAMQSFNLPLELLERIIHFSIRVRSFKRALRLRLVNRKLFLRLPTFRY